MKSHLPVNTATLVIAVVGLALSAVAITWQAATFMLTGPRIRVRLREGLRGLGGVMIAPPTMYTPAGRQVLEQQGYTEAVIAIEVVNRGRLPTTVDRWTIRFGNGAAYLNPGDLQNPPLPHRLEPHTNATWYAPVENLVLLRAAFVDMGQDAATIRGVIDLGTQDSVVSRNTLIVTDDGVRQPDVGVRERALLWLRRPRH